MASISYPFSTSIFGYLFGHHFSFFWRLWAAPGLSKVAVLKSSGGLFGFFIDFWTKNGSQKGPGREPRTPPLPPLWRSATQPRFFIDFEPILGAILMIFSRFWHTFWLSLGASVASFCQILAFKWSASTASILRCRRSPRNYNRSLEFHFPPKRRPGVTAPNDPERHGADLAPKTLKGRIFDDLGSFLIDFGRILDQFGDDFSTIVHCFLHRFF